MQPSTLQIDLTQAKETDLIPLGSTICIGTNKYMLVTVDYQNAALVDDHGAPKFLKLELHKGFVFASDFLQMLHTDIPDRNRHLIGPVTVRSI